MPILQCYVDDRTMHILKRESIARGRSVEELAEAAISNEASKSLPCSIGPIGPPLPYAPPPFDHNRLAFEQDCG